MMFALSLAWSWLKSHPKLLGLVAVLVAAGAGYAAGRFAQPARVETHETVKFKTEFKDRIVEKEARERIVYRDVVRTRTVERAPDGATKTTTTITDHSKDASSTHTDRTEVASGETHLESQKLTLTSAQPSWALRAFGTLELLGPARPQGFADVTPLLLYGGSLDRRLWGPLWLGVGGGGSYDLRSRAQGWWFGLSASATFTF